MAKIWITEYVSGGPDGRGIEMPVARAPAITTQTVNVGATSAQSSALDNATRLVRIHTDIVCHVLFGSNPTATTSNMRMAADSTEYFSVQAGQSLKIAVIAG